MNISAANKHIHLDCQQHFTVGFALDRINSVLFMILGQSEQDPVGRPLIHESALQATTGEAMFLDDIPCRYGMHFHASTS